MATTPINGISRNNPLADLWAERIQANKEAKLATGGDATSLTADGKVRVNAPGGMNVGATSASEETDNDDEYTRQIKELQKQLKRVMDQIAKVKASGMSDEMKAQQLLALNGQAVQIQGQIAQVMAQQARAAKGGVSTTA
ncbi:FlxA-like family protein [Achromobacter marplatensis]|uniref:FlxA-like family protein n=1 Tax=Achromobacter marplatensis TaxID=470868 RepID=UPI0028EEA79D|nr:FlxA-like family protein [Achromobacter marplatensis]